MKHSSSTHFSGIPYDTNTLAGQWMTFSHMANHYRKLLNVKPRVDTGLPHNNQLSSIHGSFHNFQSKMQSSRSGGKSMGSCSSNIKTSSNAKTSTNLNGSSPLYQTIRRDNIMYTSHPEHLNMCGKSSPSFLTTKESIGKEVIDKSKKVEKTKHQNHVLNYPDYQVVFGPSSIRSSTDAFMSDETESTTSGDNKPPSEIQAPIGVSEKIRNFLNNIHHLDLKPSSSKKKKLKKVTTESTAKSKSSEGSRTATHITSSSLSPPVVPQSLSVPPSVVNSSTNQVDSRLSRHSRCFLPYEQEHKSPNKCGQSQKCGTKSCAVTPTRQRKNSGMTISGNNLSSSIISLHRKQGKSKIGMRSEEVHVKSPRMSRNGFTGSGIDMHMVPEKDLSSKVNTKKKSRKRTESLTSIGTICGSEELTAEDFPLSVEDLMGLGSDDVLLSKILDENLNLTISSKKSSSKLGNSSHHHHLSSGVSSASTNGNLPKSNSMASLIPESGRSGNKSNPSVSGLTNNHEDSSRDSAYEFSSGESRITTRESTPEKKCLNGDFEGAEMQPREHLQYTSCEDVEEPGSSSDSSLQKPRQRNSKNEIPLKCDPSAEQYIMFLADLTQDIVSQGIYTNKGLKKLFKAQLEQNKELDKDKLCDMLERLRSDLGIPKDDALDKIEFGYGSISNATSTTFFYTAPSQ